VLKGEPSHTRLFDVEDGGTKETEREREQMSVSHGRGGWLHLGLVHVRVWFTALSKPPRCLQYTTLSSSVDAVTLG
jgi:hypothetical protein